jgi:signal transduction histidine kinase/ligand-binding sensor domain-containing protein/DNA-binding NarL/FixJ family response regulator
MEKTIGATRKITYGCVLPAFLLFAFVIQIRANEEQVLFNRLDVNSGLPSNEISCVFKDRKGFVWFGTGAGLVRFDGYEFRTFRHEINQMLFSEEYITHITETADGNLWITYQDGKISLCNPIRNRFYTLEDTEAAFRDFSISNVFHDKDGQLLFATHDNQLCRYDFSTGKTLTYPVDPEQGRICGAVRHGDVLYAIHSSGFIETVDLVSNTCVAGDNYLAAYPGTRRFELFCDSEGELWIYMNPENHNGLFRFNPGTKQWTHYTTTSPAALTSSLIRAVEEDAGGRIWVATDHGGINLIDKKNNTVAYLKNNPFDSRSISQNSVICLYRDNTGIIWCGTYKNGVNYYHESIFKFKSLRYPVMNPEDAGINDCNCVYEDRDGNLWIGTNGNGLLHCNRTTGRYRRYLHDPADTNSLASNIVICLAGDRDGRLWIGTYMGGLDRFDGQTFTHFKTAGDRRQSLPGNSIYSLCADENRLWAGTLGDGLNLLDPETGRCTNFNTGNTGGALLSDNIYSLSKGRDGELLIGTALGVNILNTETNRITSFTGTAGNRMQFREKAINTVFLDSRSLLWIGSNNGLSVYDAASDTLYRLDKNSGLPANDIMSVLEDSRQTLWFGTKNGLLKIVPQYSSITGAYTFPCTTYYEDEGTPGRIFNRNSVCHTTRNELILGGVEGLTLFNPHRIKYNTHPPEAVITALLLQNKHAAPGEEVDGNAILRTDICYLDRLTLKYSERNFTLRISAFNYFLPRKTKFACKMEGFDKEWTTAAAGNRNITYAGLPPGEYTFAVKAENNDGVCNPTPTLLHITILPPFWMAFPFIAACCAAIACLLYGIVRAAVRVQKQKFRKEQERINVKRLYELDEMKLRFFTNVSHEFRTPVTLIIAPLERLMKKETDPHNRKMLQLIHENAGQLLRLVNQLLDFRKIDAQQTQLLLSPGDIVLFVRNIAHSFKSLSEQKNIRFTFSSALPSLTMEFDTDKIFRIVSNLLSNAFKFTPEGGEITVTLHTEPSGGAAGANLLIQVADTGTGIAPEHCELIFNRFYQAPPAGKTIPAAGTGIGLHLCREFARVHNGAISVKSEPGKGSTFTLTLPAGKESAQQEITSPPEDPVQTEEGRAGENTAHRPVLLIADDNTGFREFMKQALCENYFILAAANGQEAWQAVTAKLPDIVVSDVMMPVMDGIELCRRIRADNRTSHIPVLLLTARTAETARLEGLQAGADDYIDKPFSMDVLLLKIQHLAELKKRMRKQLLQSMSNGMELSYNHVESPDGQLLRKTVGLIEEHISDPGLSVGWLCREMCMSRANFYKKILAITGKSPLELIRFVRMKHAAHLLANSRMRVSEAAFQIGFNDHKLFRKYFREEFGMLPSDYQEANTPAPAPEGQEPSEP